MRQILRLSFSAACVLALFSLAAADAAGIADWLAEVSAGTAAGYTNTDITGAEAFVDDIGTFDDTTGGGVSYEFIVNAGDGGVSSAFMGSLGPPVGDGAALKFEQFSDLGTYGVTLFGVADIDSGVPSVLSQDAQVVFVNDGTNTDLYVNGALATTLADVSPTLSGETGIGAAVVHSSGAFIDRLDGTLLGLAVYDAALSAEEIATHFAAFIPEPASGVLFATCVGLLGLARRPR